MSKIVISKQILKLLELGDDVINKHKADGEGSVLKSVDMKDFETKLTNARNAYDNAVRLSKEAELATETAHKLLGIHKNQKSTEPGDVLYYIYQCRDVLKGLFRGTLRKLGEWGFQVDDSTPKKKEK
jgi:hypothetical protein